MIREMLLKNFYRRWPEIKVLEKVALMDHFMLELFYKMESVEGDGEIIVSGYVMGDGLGDFIHIRRSAEEVQKKFPNRKVICIILSDLNHQGKIGPIKGFETILAFAGENTHIGPYFSKEPIFPKEVIDRLYKADLLISGPANIREPNFERFRQHDKRKVLVITEYDYEVMGATLPFAFKLKAGLNPNSHGIFIPEKTNVNEGSDHFAYFRRKETLLRYIEEVKKLYSDPKITYILRRNEPVEGPFTDLGTLSQEEFDRHIQSSKNPVGCTGDHSFVQTIASGKIPFYEQIEHKGDLYFFYQELVAAVVGKDVPLNEEGAKQVQRVLIEEFDLGKCIQGAANWVLYKYCHPEYAKIEREWFDRVTSGQINIEEFTSLIYSHFHETSRNHPA